MRAVEKRVTCPPGWRRVNVMLSAGALVCSTFIAIAADKDNVRFHGILVSQPCELDAGSEDFEVPFGSVVDKGLYVSGRTRGVPLEIRLKNCDTAISPGVKVTFTGTESGELPGLLAVNDAKGSRGIAVGLEDIRGTAFVVNKSGPLQKLTTGENVVALRAYVQGEPTALSGKTLVPGDFSVTATFALEYE